jgi:hypothetical protein
MPIRFWVLHDESGKQDLEPQIIARAVLIATQFDLGGHQAVKRELPGERNRQDTFEYGMTSGILGCLTGRGTEAQPNASSGWSGEVTGSCRLKTQH